MVTKSRRKQKSILGRVLLWFFLLLIISVSAVSLYGYFWMQSYLKGPGFGGLVARELGEATKSRAVLEGFVWNDPNAFISTATLTPKAKQGWTQIKGDSIEASLDWSAVRSGVWSIPLISLGSLEIDVGSTAKERVTVPDDETDTPPAAAAPAWLKRWLPKRTEIGEVVVEKFHLIPGAAATVAVKDMSVSAKPGSESSAAPNWALRGRDGELTLPGVSVPFRMSSINARLDDAAFTVNEATAAWVGDSEITARGQAPFGKGKAWNFVGHLSKLDFSHLLSETWQQKVSGIVEGEYEASAAGLKGSLEIKNGVVQNMPLLERVADFTRTARFRRLVFDIATADVSREGRTTKVSKMVLQSNGLLRVEGGFTTDSVTIKGEFDVGVTADSLRWIPGSQSRVFTETRPGSPGLVWTKVRISGPVARPQEDLSNRLLEALGKALLIDTPLGLAGDAVGTGVGVGGKVLEGGTEVLKGNPGKAVETGVDILKGLVPIFGK